MDNLTYIRTITKQEGTSGLVNHVILRRNDVIELLKMLEGLKKQLQLLLKKENGMMV